MPKVIRRQKYIKNYSEDMIQNALFDIKMGHSKNSAAKKYGIPRSTLQFRLGKSFKKIRPGPKTYLSENEEQILVNWHVECSEKGFSRRKDDILASVKKFLDENPRINPFKNNIPGNHWYKSFLKRHKILSERVPEPVTNASAKVSESNIKQWFEDIEHYLKKNNLFNILSDASRIFNGDETCFHLCPNTGKVLAPRGSKNVYEVDQGPAKVNITVMFTFSGAGTLTPPMVIYPNKRLPPAIAASVPEDWGIGLSDNGWMKSEIFYEYIGNILYPYLLKMNVQFPIIMFVDGHKTHLTYELSTLCSKLKIILIALYPNATRIIQPADVSCFKPLKTAWKQVVLKWRRENPYCLLNKNNFAPLLKDALDSLTADTIINGFKACGLFPWDPTAIDSTKCLGKNHSSSDKKTFSNLTFDQFTKAVGPEKLHQLENTNNCSSYNEDFRALFRVYKLFFNTNDVSTQTKDEEVLQMVNEHNVNDNKENYTEEEIMNMPILLTANQDNSNIENYLVWQNAPERSGNRKSKRLPYVITSSAFKNIQEEKKLAIMQKEEKRKEKIKVKIEKQKLKNEITNNKIKIINKSKKDYPTKVKIEKLESKDVIKTTKIKNTKSKNSNPIKILSNEVITDPAEKKKNLYHMHNLFTDTSSH